MTKVHLTAPSFAAVPGQCEKPTITEVCVESMTVNWDEPKYDGGSSITGYFVERKETTSKRWARVTREPIRALPLGNNWDVTGLQQGALYQFRVIAVNAAGCGLPSIPSDPILCRDPISKKKNLYRTCMVFKRFCAGNCILH